jgi:hypothetical protein
MLPIGQTTLPEMMATFANCTIPRLLSTSEQLPRRIPVWAGASHLETAAKLLSSLKAILAIFSKRALKSLNNQADFDSAIRRFDPSRPSQLILLV